MAMRWLIYSPIVFILVIVGVFYKALQTEPTQVPSPLLGKPLPIFELTDWSGQRVTRENLGDQSVVLHFWASWCAPCKREMPSLEKLSENYPQIKVYPINMEPPNKLRAKDFFKSVNVMSLGIYFDPKLELVKKFKMKGLPTSILIDKNGNEFGRVIGEIDFNSEEFKNLLKKYI